MSHNEWRMNRLKLLCEAAKEKYRLVRIAHGESADYSHRNTILQAKLELDLIELDLQHEIERQNNQIQEGSPGGYSHERLTREVRKSTQGTERSGEESSGG